MIEVRAKGGGSNLNAPPMPRAILPGAVSSPLTRSVDRHDVTNATVIDEIADGIYRIAKHLDGFGSATGVDVCQFVVDAEEPLLVHTGMRDMFGDVLAACSRIHAIERFRWLTFSHVEGDECGAINEFLGAATRAHVVFSTVGCAATVDGLAVRRPVRLDDGETLDLGGRRIRAIATPHVPHNWEAQLLYEEVTGTLFCSDLLAQAGRTAALTTDLGVVERAAATRVSLASAPPGPAVPDTLRELAKLEPSTLAAMHGSSLNGDGGAAFRLLADHYDGASRLR